MKSFIKDIKEFFDIKEIAETNPLEAIGISVIMIVAFWILMMIPA